MGISQNAYSKIENNITQLTVNHVKQISVILDVPIIELLKDEFEIRKPQHAVFQKVARKDIILFMHDLQHSFKLKKTEEHQLYSAILTMLQSISSISEGIE